MKTTSVRTTSSTLFDSAAEVTVTPFDLVAELEEAMQANFLKPVRFSTTFEPVSLAELVKRGAEGSRGLVKAMGGIPELRAFWDRRALADAKWTQRIMVHQNHGKFIDDKFREKVAKAKKGLESTEDRLACLVDFFEKEQSLKEWQDEQNRHQEPENYKRLKGTFVLPPRLFMVKKLNREYVKGSKDPSTKDKWISKEVEKSEMEGLLEEGWLPKESKLHKPSFYSIRLPDRRSANMAQQQGNYEPKTELCASWGIRDLAIRLGFIKGNHKGGETAILNLMLGHQQVEWVEPSNETEEEPDAEQKKPEPQKVWPILPVYKSYWIKDHWITRVSWRKNPKITFSKFWEFDGELTEENPNRKFDKKTRQWVILPEDHKNYLRPLTVSQLDYTLIKQACAEALHDEKGEETDFVNEEEEFLTAFPERENEPDFIDFSKYCDDDEEMELFGSVSNVVERSEQGITLGDIRSKQYQQDYLSDGIDRMKESIARIKNSEPTDEKSMEDSLKWLNILETNLARLERLEGLSDKYANGSNEAALVAHWYPTNGRHLTYGASKLNGGHFVPKDIPGASESPLNAIEQPRTFEPSRPASFQMTLDQAKQLRRQKQVCQSIIKGRFGMLVREKKAADHFATTLDTLLGVI